LLAINIAIIVTAYRCLLLGYWAEISISPSKSKLLLFTSIGEWNAAEDGSGAGHEKRVSGFSLEIEGTESVKKLASSL
jgi:hypothetical protein